MTKTGNPYQNMEENLVLQEAFEYVFNYFFNTGAFFSRVIHKSEINNIYNIPGNSSLNLELLKKDIFIAYYKKLNTKRRCFCCNNRVSILYFQVGKRHCFSCVEQFAKLTKLRQYVTNVKRKSRIKAVNDKTITPKELHNLLLIQNYECVYCGCSLLDNKHLDHIIPLSKGGMHSLKNVQYLCPHCNLVKHNKIYA